MVGVGVAVVGVGVAVVGVGFTPKSPVGTGLFRGVRAFSECSRSVKTAGLRAGISPGSHPMHNLRADGTGFGRKGTARHRAGTNRTAERFGHRSSSPAGAARRSRCRGRAYRRPKSLPGRAPAVKRPSAPGYHPHRLRHGTESPTVEVSPAPLLPTRCFLLGERHSSERPVPQQGLLFEEALHFASTIPGKPPTFHPALRPHAPSILTFTKQRVSKTAKRGISKTMGQHNSTTGKQEGHEFKTPRLHGVSTY